MYPNPILIPLRPAIANNLGLGHLEGALSLDLPSLPRRSQSDSGGLVDYSEPSSGNTHLPGPWNRSTGAPVQLNMSGFTRLRAREAASPGVPQPAAKWPIKTTEL